MFQRVPTCSPSPSGLTGHTHMVRDELVYSRTDLVRSKLRLEGELSIANTELDAHRLAGRKKDTYRTLGVIRGLKERLVRVQAELAATDRREAFPVEVKFVDAARRLLPETEFRRLLDAALLEVGRV